MVNDDEELHRFIDRVVVPALVQRLTAQSARGASVMRSQSNDVSKAAMPPAIEEHENDAQLQEA